MPERPSRNTASDMRRRDRTSNQAARQGHAWTRGWREAQRYRQKRAMPEEVRALQPGQAPEAATGPGKLVPLGQTTIEGAIERTRTLPATYTPTNCAGPVPPVTISVCHRQPAACVRCPPLRSQKRQVSSVPDAQHGLLNCRYPFLHLSLT